MEETFLVAAKGQGSNNCWLLPMSADQHYKHSEKTISEVNLFKRPVGAKKQEKNGNWQ